MNETTQPARPALVDIEFVAGVYRSDIGLRPDLHRTSGRMRSPMMHPRSRAPMPRGEPIAFQMPPLRDIVWPLVWILVTAVPILLRVGWQAAVVTAAVALVVREARHMANRSTISFGDGFLAYAGTNGWPHGVQEDDDVHWNWSGVKAARPGHGAGG
jgi:hypothetical protein